jgi:hypothetical protein
MLKKMVILCLVALMVAVPIVMHAQIGIPPMKHPKEQGAKDAARDVNHIVWFGSGLLLGPIGLSIAYMMQPAPPPAERLMGKSDIYVKEYTATYKTVKKDLQVNDALAGCIPSTLIWFSLIFLSTQSNGDE